MSAHRSIDSHLPSSDVENFDESSPLSANLIHRLPATSIPFPPIDGSSDQLEVEFHSPTRSNFVEVDAHPAQHRDTYLEQMRETIARRDTHLPWLRAEYQRHDQLELQELHRLHQEELQRLQQSQRAELQQLQLQLQQETERSLQEANDNYDEEISELERRHLEDMDRIVEETNEDLMAYVDYSSIDTPNDFVALHDRSEQRGLDAADDQELEPTTPFGASLLPSTINLHWLLDDERGEERSTDDVEESASLGLCFSRSCRVCFTDAPRHRAVFSSCGHVLCLACAEQLKVVASGERKELQCPFCRNQGGFVKLYEHVIDN